MYQSDSLPRRAFLGAELKASSSTENKGDSHQAEGLLVMRVVPGGAAAEAGLQARDMLLAINDVPVKTAGALLSQVRGLRCGDALRLLVKREGEELQLSTNAVALPVETLNNCDIELGFIEVRGHRQRTLWAKPRHGEPPYPAILYMQGLGNQSIELSQDPDEPLRAMLQGFCDKGFISLRVERRGVGDSLGPGCEETDLFNEIEAYREALRVLGERADIGPVFLLGHSVGGMIAPLLLGEALPISNIKGAIVFGTSPLRWIECMQWATRGQRQLAGLSGEELEAYVGAWMEMHTLICRGGLSPSQIFEQFPHLGWLKGTSCNGETLFGRHISFFQQLERLDLFALWRTVSVPVLVLHGSLDWAAGLEHGRAIADALNQAHPGRASFVELSGIGHDFRKHASLEASYKKPREGRYDPAILDAIFDWMKNQGWISE